MLITHLIHPAPRRPPLRSRGFGLLQVLLLISVVAGLATMGYLQWRERSAINSARQERQALAQADRAIQNFATVMRRMPCPDVDRDGLEDCGASDQKGWLPSVSLALAGADPGVGVGQLRYLVQRGGGENDLTVLTDSWRPLEYDETGRTFGAMRELPAAGTYKANALTLADLCQRLEKGRTTPYAAGMAEVRASTVRTVAYALVHPGNGNEGPNNSLFDGANASTDPAVEDPARRPLLAAYNDVVLERSYQSLLISFHCQPLLDSINTVALAHDVVEQVHDLKEGNIDSANQAIAFAAIAAGITAIETTATVLEGISEAGNAAVAWALCAATLGLAVNACAAAPQHTFAIVTTGVTIGLNAGSIAANVTAAIKAGNALALADSGVNAGDLTCPSADYKQAIDAATADEVKARNEYNAIRAQLVAKRNELGIARNTRAVAVDTLFARIRAGFGSSEIDGRVQPLLEAAANWESRSFDFVEVATRNRNDAQKAVNQWATQVADYTNMVNYRVTLLTQLNSDIASLDQQIASLSQQIATLDQQINAEQDAAAKAALEATRASLNTTREARQTERLSKTSQRVLLSDQTALQAEYDRAVNEYATAQSNLIAAQAAWTLAQSSLGAAQNSFQAAYNNLRNAGRYTLFVGGLPAGTACASTSAGVCEDSDINTSSSIQLALNDLLGGNFSSPDPDGKYLKPFKLEREVKALEDQEAPALKRVDDAVDLLVRLQGLAAAVPKCEISGSGVTPMKPDISMGILIQVDEKGGTR